MEKLTNVKALEIAIASVSDADVVAKLQTMKAQFEKKNHADRKPTANQLDNEKFKNVILANMGDTAWTITDIQKNILGDYPELSNQRVSAIMKQLLEDNSVTREVVKRKAMFTKIAD